MSATIVGLMAVLDEALIKRGVEFNGIDLRRDEIVLRLRPEDVATLAHALDPAPQVFVDANSKIAGLRAERDEARVELERGVRAFNRHGDSSLWKIKADDLHRSLQALREGVRGVVNWLAVDDAAEDSEAVIRRLDALLDTAPEEEGS